MLRQGCTPPDRWFWFVEDLTDPECNPRPLAAVVQGHFRWAPGEPRERNALTNALIRSLPLLVTEGVAFAGQNSIQEGLPWNTEG